MEKRTIATAWKPPYLRGRAQTRAAASSCCTHVDGEGGDPAVVRDHVFLLLVAGTPPAWATGVLARAGARSSPPGVVRLAMACRPVVRLRPCLFLLSTEEPSHSCNLRTRREWNSDHIIQKMHVRLYLQAHIYLQPKQSNSYIAHDIPIRMCQEYRELISSKEKSTSSRFSEVRQGWPVTHQSLKENLHVN